MVLKNHGPLTKSEAIIKIRNCAKLYMQNLLGKNLLFITDKEGEIGQFEVSFLKRNFKHFTGVDTEKSGIGANKFFDAAISNRLNLNDFEIPKDGTAEMKLSVLSSLMSIHQTARMLGDYNDSKSLLITDKIAGTVTAVMGFVKEDGFYVPNTVLREDLRNITIKPRQVVLMMFLKNRKDIQYFELTYIKKGLMINDVKFMDILARKVDLEKLKASFEIPYNKISAT